MTNIKYLLPLLLLAGISFLVVCQSNDPLEQNIKDLYQDKEFNCTDFDQLVNYLEAQKSSRRFSKYFADGRLDKRMVISLVEKTLNTSLPDLLNCNSEVDVKPSTEKVNVFIENSGSMDGYVEGITDYEAVLSDIIIEANHYYGKERISVNFITDKPYPTKINNISSFFKSLDPKRAPFNIGNKSVSELNELFKIVLDSTAKNDISIFVSDCIYSLDKSSSTVNGLMFQQSLTKAVFLDKSKEFPVSAYLLQLYSSFTGNYYNHSNSKVKLNGASRPYYIWILGEDSMLKEFLSKLKPKQYKGFTNSYFMTANAGDSVMFEVLASTNKLGKSRFHRRDKATLENVELSNNIFQFSFAADLSDYPDEISLLDKKLYKITPSFELVSIEPIPENNQPTLVKASDWTKIGNKGYSHVFTVKTEINNFPSDFHLAFVSKIPSWVSRHSTDDDTDILKNLDKTFGLKYLVAGVQSAFETLNGTKENTFSINLKLNR